MADALALRRRQEGSGDEAGERYWWCRFECENGPAATAYRLLSDIDIGLSMLSW